MFFLFGCARKRDTAQEVQAWLDTSFPGQFEILKTQYAMNQWISTDRSSFNILLGSKADPDIQFTIPWSRGAEAGGMTKSALEERYQKVIQELKALRTLQEQLQKNGLQHFSLGKRGGFVDVMLFAEPAPAFRLQAFAALQQALEAWPPAEQSTVQLLFMEPGCTRPDFEQIIPSRQVNSLEKNLWQQDNCVQFAQFEWRSGMPVQEMDRHTQVNSSALRTAVYREEAFRRASDWAKKNLKKPFQLEADQPTGEQVTEEAPMAIQYWFPFFSGESASPETAEVAGYLVIAYQTESKIYSSVKQEKPEAF